ncbi:FkbM family methyltransferase [Luteimonas sp. A501]
MNHRSIRSLLKQALPGPVRRVLRALLHYAQRIGRWAIILWQVRGSTWHDQLTLFRSALAAPVISLRNPLAWQDPYLLADAAVEVRGVGRFLLRGRCDDLWHVLPWREQGILDEIRSQLAPGDVFIDAGANIGVYTVLASRLVGPSGQVIAVEMMPDTAGRLEHHIKINGLQNVTMVRRALSNIAGRIVTATVQSGKFGQATIAEDADRYGVGSRVDVTTTTLDEIAAGIPSIALMKMDLEGAELQALQGAECTMANLRAAIYENWSRTRSEDDPLDRAFVEHGFQLRRVDGNNWLAVRNSV